MGATVILDMRKGASSPNRKYENETAIA